MEEDCEMRRSILSLLLALFAASTAAAQNPGRIVGTVSSEGGRALPRAQVTIVGTAQNVVAGADGTYLLVVLPGTYQLQARLLGYAPLTQEVTVAAGQTVTADFQLTIAPIQLEGIVVVGYGTQERRDVTGAIATVQEEQLKEVPTNDPVKALQGRVAGVDIQTTNFAPGAPMNVRIRGVRSMVASNDPLYVVDGIPISGDITDFDPANIKSIEVLKDASATAIYGSRGANGVVLITTVGASRAPGTSITYDAYFGAQSAVKLVDMMNAIEFAQVKKEAWLTAGRDTSDASVYFPQELVTVLKDRDCVAAGQDPSTCPTTDWQRTIYRTGFQQNHEFALNTASEDTRLSVSARYFDQSALTEGQQYQVYSGNLSLEHQVGRLRLGVAAQGIRSNNDINDGNGVWGMSLNLSPMGMPYDTNGVLDWKPTPDPLLVNPIVQNQQSLRTVTRNRFFGSAFAELELAQGLTWRMNFGPDITNATDGAFHGPQTTYRNGTLADASRNDIQIFAYTLDNLVTLNRQLNPSNRINATFLYSVQHSRSENTYAAASNLPYNQQLWYNLGTGEIRSGVGSSLSEWALRSYMGRINYSLADKYLLTVTGRWDGSSRLAPGNQWAFFPSVGLGWQLGNESFVRNLGFFSNLKIRGSYGRTGNTGIDPYQTEGSVSQTRYNFGATTANGYRPGQIPNPDLQWEKTDQYDAGLEFGILNNRISGTIDWYRQNTHDLLMQRQLPATSGFTQTLQNIGETRNQGIELGLSLVPVDGTVRWSLDMNATHNKNQIISLYGDTLDDVGNLWFIGQPINFFTYNVASNAGSGDALHGVFYDYEFDGIWQSQDSALAASFGQKVGQIRVVDQNGDGVINADDRVIIGSSYPNWVGSIYNRVTWKWLDFSALLSFRLGYTLFDQFGISNARFDGRYNDLHVPYWSLARCANTPTEPTCNVNPRPDSGREAPTYSTARGYLSGGHARVRNITVGVTLPERYVRWIRAKSLRIYATVQEPFLFSSYVGYDPEGGTSGGAPNYRTFLMGANFGF
jgi:TonB-linked SusC/RagA family outer membrane protein